MEKLNNYLVKELTREPQTKKPSLQDFAKRMLVGFFVLMLLLTVLSRAADSVTVAKVSVASLKRGILNFEITGNGTIEAAAEKYLDLYEGVKVESVAAKVGQTVEEGDLLFTYDLYELEKIRESLQRDYTIASLNFKKGELNREAEAATTEAQTARIAVKRAELDLELAKLELETAKNNIEKEKNEQLEAARVTLTDAKEVMKETEEDKTRAINEARKEITKAEEAFEELFQDKKKVEEVLGAYKTAAQNSTTKILDTVVLPVTTDNSAPAGIPGDLFYDADEYSKSLTGISESFQDMLHKVFAETERKAYTRDETQSESAQNNTDPLLLAERNIFLQYYGEEGYHSHAEEVRLAQQRLVRAKEDYMLAFISAGESGMLLGTNQKAACVRAYEDANIALQKLTGKDRELSNAILAYGIAIQSNSEADSTSTYNTLFSLLYREDEKKQKEISDARKLITALQEKLTMTTSDWDRKLSKVDRDIDKAKEKFYEALDICDRIDNQTYDYITDLQVWESKVTGAERSLEDAKAALERAEQRDEAMLASNLMKDKISQIDTQINEMELEKKKNAVKEIDNILEQKGQVKSPVTGVLLFSDLKVGGRISGSEKVSISTDNYSFSAKVAKDEVKHLAPGDEINISLVSDRRIIETTVESVGPIDAEGVSEITAILPEGEYGIGASATFSVNKKSKQYDQTIPLQAVRMDQNQVYYVLVIQEKNTTLGNEMIAYRRNINILEKNYQTAAIEAAISTEDNIIVSSSKSIEEGDRVRINE